MGRITIRWIHKVCKLLSIATAFYIIDNIAIIVNVEIDLIMKTAILIGQIGYIFTGMIELINDKED